jgi:hypothetical protein
MQSGLEEEMGSAAAVFGNKPIQDIHLPQETVTETFTQARDEVLNEEQQTVVEFAQVMLQFGYVALFGAVWPLVAFIAFFNNFAVQRLDMWKFCTFVRRPMAFRMNGIGPLWETILETFAIAGITNHVFILAVSSRTMVRPSSVPSTVFHNARPQWSSES